MQRLLYISCASEEYLETNALNELAEHAIQRNQQNNITGVLFYLGGYFMQFLEGPADALSETFSRIKADVKHSEVEVLFFEEAGDRIFPNWGMSANFVEFSDVCPDITRVIDSLRLAIKTQSIKDCLSAMEYFFAPKLAQ